MDKRNILKSQYDVTLESRVSDNGSNILAVLLPGIGYTLERPLLDYSKKLCMELGYDVLGLEYGFQLSGKEFEKEKINIIIDETYKLLKMSLDSRYKKIIFIGKSLGTIIQIYLEDKLVEEGYKFDFKNIYLTPVNFTAESGVEEGSLIVTGTNDPLINEESINKIEEISKVDVVKIDGADHSMNVDHDVVKSSEILTYIIKKEKEYLINNV
ncbi:MAG: alpha/beta hydrolase [Clostridium sp.]